MGGGLSVEKDGTERRDDGMCRRHIHYSWGSNLVFVNQEVVFERVESVPGKIESYGGTGNVTVTAGVAANTVTIRGKREGAVPGGSGIVTITYRPA